MDAEKVNVEVEMKELNPAEVQEDKESEKGKTEGTKGTKSHSKFHDSSQFVCSPAWADFYFYFPLGHSLFVNLEAEKVQKEKEKEKEVKDEGNVYSKLNEGNTVTCFSNSKNSSVQ